MGLIVAEDRDCSLVYGGEINEKHVEAAAPVVCLLRCAFNYDGLSTGA